MKKVEQILNNLSIKPSDRSSDFSFSAKLGKTEIIVDTEREDVILTLAQLHDMGSVDYKFLYELVSLIKQEETEILELDCAGLSWLKLKSNIRVSILESGPTDELFYLLYIE